jgi:hypothetical protein
MGSPVAPLSLALCAALADAAGLHHAAFYLVLLAVPFAAGAALSAAGELAEGRRTGLRTVCTGLALGLLVLSSAVRANAPVGGALPALAVSALFACIGAYGMLGLAWLARPPLPQAVPQPEAAAD